MIGLLGQRPFTSKDDMDKWLDENRKPQERSAPPPLEDIEPEETPAPVATRVKDMDL